MPSVKREAPFGEVLLGHSELDLLGAAAGGTDGDGGRCNRQQQRRRRRRAKSQHLYHTSSWMYIDVTPPSITLQGWTRRQPHPTPVHTRPHPTGTCIRRLMPAIVSSSVIRIMKGSPKKCVWWCEPPSCERRGRRVGVCVNDVVKVWTIGWLTHLDLLDVAD